MAVIKHRLTDDHDEWLKQRNKGIGGSDAGAVMGVNPYKSAYTLWAEKTGKTDGYVPDNERMRFGRDLEEYVARRFCEETGKKVQRSGFSYQSADKPWMLANIDRKVVGENAGLECKTAGLFAQKTYTSGEIPPPILLPMPPLYGGTWFRQDVPGLLYRAGGAPCFRSRSKRSSGRI